MKYIKSIIELVLTFILSKSRIKSLNLPISNKKTVYIFPAAAPGGVGDDAMVNGSIQGIRQSFSGEIKIIVEKNFNEISDSFCSDVSYLKIVGKYTFPSKIIKNLNKNSTLIILGADILDGHYSVFDACRRIILCNFANSNGINSRIIGFSLNASPDYRVLKQFNLLPYHVPLYLRDSISFNRAKKKISGNINLSADAAFLLKPSFSDKLNNFIDFKTDKTKFLFGINIHSLLFGIGNVKDINLLAESIANMIHINTEDSFVFIPHDFRDYVDDRKAINLIKNFLNEDDLNRCYFVENEINAAEIKYICGNLDGIITARMHLAIASLGQAIPVMGIVYQGKFEGTFSHFDLSDECLISPIDASDKTILNTKFLDWKSKLGLNRSKISKNLSNVMQLSYSNFLNI